MKLLVITILVLGTLVYILIQSVDFIKNGETIIVSNKNCECLRVSEIHGAEGIDNFKNKEIIGGRAFSEIRDPSRWNVLDPLNNWIQWLDSCSHLNSGAFVEKNTCVLAFSNKLNSQYT